MSRQDSTSRSSHRNRSDERQTERMEHFSASVWSNFLKASREPPEKSLEILKAVNWKNIASAQFPFRPHPDRFRSKLTSPFRLSGSMKKTENSSSSRGFERDVLSECHRRPLQSFSHPLDRGSERDVLSECHRRPLQSFTHPLEHSTDASSPATSPCSSWYRQRPIISAPVWSDKPRGSLSHSAPPVWTEMSRTGDTHCGKLRLASDSTQASTLAPGLDGNAFVVSQKVVERQVRRPKKVLIEEVVEKLIAIPETRIREELGEDIGIARQKIIEVAKPIYREVIVEVPEIEFVEKLVEVPEKIIEEKIREVPVIEYKERIIEIPKFIEREKIVEFEQLEYREVPVERLEEVVEIHEQVVFKQVTVPHYVDKPYPEFVDVEEFTDVVKNIPVPVECLVAVEFKLPQIRPHWKTVDIPLFVPRFVEIPIPEDAFVDEFCGEELREVVDVCHATLSSRMPFESLTSIECFSRFIEGLNFASLVGGQHFVKDLVHKQWTTARKSSCDSSGTQST